MDTATVADAHQTRVIQISDLATSRALRQWRKMEFTNLDASWATLGPQIIAQATGAQFALASQSDAYTSQVSKSFDNTPDLSRVIPGALAGVDGEGRAVDGLLFGSVTTTKEAVGAGFGAAQSMQAGASYLAAMMKTVIHDIGRSSDMVAATGKGYTHYVRVVNPGACSRCAILSGISSFKRAFQRHPACKCTTCAVMSDDPSDIPAGLHADPDSYFESLPKAEQDRIFTAAGAEAIRNGAGIQEVVSARRGARGISSSRGIGNKTVPNSGRRLTKTRIGTAADGSPIEVYTTSEGTTIRGNYGGFAQKDFATASQKVGNNRYSTTKRARLMPESIMAIAKTPEEAKALLRDGGYMGIPNLPAAERIAQARADRDIADKAYARAGFTL